jgi:hypothetical protein
MVAAMPQISIPGLPVALSSLIPDLSMLSSLLHVQLSQVTRLPVGWLSRDATDRMVGYLRTDTSAQAAALAVVAVATCSAAVLLTPPARPRHDPSEQPASDMLTEPRQGAHTMKTVAAARARLQAAAFVRSQILCIA